MLVAVPAEAGAGAGCDAPPGRKTLNCAGVGVVAAAGDPYEE